MTSLLTLVLAIVATMSRMHVNADPCRTNFGGCDRYDGLCWGTGNFTHFCTCKAGYEEYYPGGSPYCIDVDECSEDPELCPENAVCENTIGSYKCTCKCGYVKDYTGQYCLDHSKITGMCEVPASCYNRNGRFSRRTSFNIAYSRDFLTDLSRKAIIKDPVRTGSCKCETGFTFDRCGYCVDEDECFIKRPCRGFRSRCVNTEGSYYCECPDGYVLGPCRVRCYRQEQDIPVVCDDRDLNDLKWQGVTIKTYVQPITLHNWRTCASGVRVGDTTTERYDIDHDGVQDVTLTWACSNHTRTGVFSVLKNVAEKEARWGQWSCWTACKATCWGGLQTRVRECLHGLPGMEGCIGEGTQKRQCYTGKKCPFRIRKNVLKLTRAEERDLLQAMRKYKEDTSASGFFNAAAAHGWPRQCKGRMCCPHGAKMKFLTWHRTLMLNYEQGLSRYLLDKTLGIPYWDWLGQRNGPPDLVMKKFLYGQPNPFANMTVRIDRQGSMRTIQRDNTVFTESLDAAEKTWWGITEKLMKPHLWHEFSESLESSHSGPHAAVCGSGQGPPKCRISLARLQFAGFDPLFLFHHSQVDRLWAVAQDKIAKDRKTTWSVQTALEPMEAESDFGQRQMPFGNETLTPFPIVRAVNTMRDSYYYEELTGVKYDTLNVVKVADKITRTLEALFVAHYLQSVEENVYINYYFSFFGDRPCSELRDIEWVGQTQLQGTSNRYRNTVPRLIPLMDRLGNSDLDEDFVVKACYTSSPTCRQNCPEVTNRRIASMPGPALVHYVPNQPVDVYKFTWGEGTRLPNWYINLDAKSQWVYFYGDRTQNIRQVRTSREWMSCNAQRGRVVPCSTNACVFPSGIYYLIDNNPAHCRKGLKMLIVSRK